MAAGRAFLVGEAAHVFPPIGAQGLNLGLRDAAELARLLPRALKRASDDALLGAAASYERARRSDIRLRTFAVDALDRTLLADILPADFARGLGQLALGTIGPLRRFVMRQGLGAG
jgi:2-octaprenyl-6-methoxyphenol hydroxylase